MSWEQTLAAGDNGHVLYYLREFINPELEGADERIRYAKQALQLLEYNL